MWTCGRLHGSPTVSSLAQPRFSLWSVWLWPKHLRRQYQSSVIVFWSSGQPSVFSWQWCKTMLPNIQRRPLLGPSPCWILESSWGCASAALPAHPLSCPHRPACHSTPRFGVLIMDTMDSQDGLKTIALPLFLNIFFYFLLQLLCVMISHWLTVLKHKMLSQILIKNVELVW